MEVKLTELDKIIQESGYSVFSQFGPDDLLDCFISKLEEISDEEYETLNKSVQDFYVSIVTYYENEKKMPIIKIDMATLQDIADGKVEGNVFEVDGEIVSTVEEEEFSIFDPISIRERVIKEAKKRKQGRPRNDSRGRTKVKGKTATRHVKEMIIENPNIQAGEIIRRMKDMRLSISPKYVRTMTSQLRENMRILRDLGRLKDEYSKF